METYEPGRIGYRLLMLLPTRWGNQLNGNRTVANSLQLKKAEHSPLAGETN